MRSVLRCSAKSLHSAVMSIDVMRRLYDRYVAEASSCGLLTSRAAPKMEEDDVERRLLMFEECTASEPKPSVHIWARVMGLEGLEVMQV